MPDFGEIVRDYERLSEPLTSVYARRALELAAISPGEHIIDVASGTGALAVAAAERGAGVLATDIAPPMVMRAAERLKPFPGCEARVMSLEALDAPDGAFAAAFSIFGIMIVPCWEQGLRELLRVTRPGGRIGVTAWVDREDGAPANLVKRVFEDTFPGRKLWPDDFFPAWSQEAFAEALRAAGCVDVDVQVHRGTWILPSVKSVMDDGKSMLKIFPGFAALTETEQERLREPVEAAVGAYARADGSVRLPAHAYIGIGRKT